VKVQLHAFLTSALVEVSGHLYAPAALPQGVSRNRLIEGWVGPRVGLEAVARKKNSQPLSEIEPRLSSP